jgi:hypothetical protein
MIESGMAALLGTWMALRAISLHSLLMLLLLLSDP